MARQELFRYWLFIQGHAHHPVIVVPPPFTHVHLKTIKENRYKRQNTNRIHRIQHRGRKKCAATQMKFTIKDGIVLPTTVKVKTIYSAAEISLKTP